MRFVYKITSLDSEQQLALTNLPYSAGEEVEVCVWEYVEYEDAHYVNSEPDAGDILGGVSDIPDGVSSADYVRRLRSLGEAIDTALTWGREEGEYTSAPLPEELA